MQMTKLIKALWGKLTSHWAVLVIGVLAAIGLWLWWLFSGMEWVHSSTVRHVTQMQASQPSRQLMAEPKSNQQTAAPASVPTDDRANVFAELGQTGDSFGGFTALLTAIAGALVAWAGYMQHQTLKQAREEAKEEHKHRQRQNFESLFFQLLQLSASVTDKIERKGTKSSDGVRNGSRALDSYASTIFKSILETPIGGELKRDPLKCLVEKFLALVYDKNPSAFGPYFRLLYQTFKHIAESDLSDAEQIRYANIARGQISEGAILLLALNGLTVDGYKFVSLIEKFGLLEHLHRRYRTAYLGILSVGYRSRAFMGSEERSRPINAWIAEPMLKDTLFAELEKSRTNGDAEVDFEVGFNSEQPHDE